MYCTNDLWQLRVRRRRTRFLKADADSSGSDAEDWVAGEEDPGDAAAGMNPTSAAPTTAAGSAVGLTHGSSSGGQPTVMQSVGDAEHDSSSGSLVSWNPTAGGKSKDMAAAAAARRVTVVNPHDREAWQSALDDMQDKYLDMKMQLSDAQQRFAAETLARKQAEHDRDVALERASDARMELEAYKRKRDEAAAVQEAEVR
jgi:hypothetical protein